MAATSQVVNGATQGDYFDKRPLALGFAAMSALYLWVYWYKAKYGWSAGLEAYAPEFRTYWMNLLYVQMIVAALAFAGLCGGLWRTRDRKMEVLEPRRHLRRHFYHLSWLAMYAYALYWGASYFTEQDATWHQTVVRDTDFTPAHINQLLAYPVYIIMGMGSFMYAKTRLPYFARGISLPYLVSVVGPFMILPNLGFNEWGHTFWWMEELFVAPVHLGFVLFGWLAMAISGVLLQTFAAILPLIDDGRLKDL